MGHANILFCVACICFAVNRLKVQMMHRLSRERYFIFPFHKKKSSGFSCYMHWIQLTSLFYSYLSLRTLVLTNQFSNWVFIFSYTWFLLYWNQLAVECIFCSACIRFAECCPQEGLNGLFVCLFSFFPRKCVYCIAKERKKFILREWQRSYGLDLRILFLIG